MSRHVVTYRIDRCAYFDDEEDAVRFMKEKRSQQGVTNVNMTTLAPPPVAQLEATKAKT